jgi:hypothetical protein
VKPRPLHRRESQMSSSRVRYKKKMRDRAILDRKFLVTVSVNGKHLRDDSCTVQALVDLAEAKRLTKVAVALLKKPEEKADV